MSFYNKLLNLKDRGGIYVIAEVGSNYKTHDDLVGAIALAKSCGADAVKYQYLHQSELYGPAYNFRQQTASDFPLKRLKEKCDFFGLEFLCTAFSPQGVAEVDPYVSAHKVASSEMQHMRLLEAIKETGKPILLSTGAQSLSDIGGVFAFLVEQEVVPLHCNVAYPAKFIDMAKLRRIKELADVWGFSDHTTSIDLIPQVIKNMGATVLEKHFNPFDYTNTPDAPHSLSVDEFKTMVNHLRGDFTDFSEENEARLMHIRRIVATKNIKEGETLKEGINMGIFRSKKPDPRGVSPFAIKDLEGKVVLNAKEAGDGISLTDV